MLPSLNMKVVILNSLPQHLKERVRTLSEHPLREDGEYVLYWMHHAVRDDENPALDAAIHIASTLNIPLLVYQGLSGAHRFNSDRHFTFILEGACDVAAQFKRRGIRYAFHLNGDSSAASPLYALGRQAALVITEDYPSPPFPRWVNRLAEQITTPVWAVDSHCIIPMQSIGKWYSRAYHFRNKIASNAWERAAREWPTVEATPPYYSEELTWNALDWDTVSIPELCASCDIDHSIGPIHHTRGGMLAGNERWSAYLENGLNRYDKTRDDPILNDPSGISRLSAYLHHGHVSPFKVARDAVREASSGAQKFLDELLIWRELAFNLCFHNNDVQEISILPQWAQDSFERHLQDEREKVYDWEDFACSRTGDPLWNLAQQSLRIHGELHNNVRMTWGKAVLNWTASPQEALDILLDLNNRYALDGSDPNSYAGILWCLGLLDRPFPPEKPILGLVRPRSSARHQARIDMGTYASQLARFPRMASPKVAIIGAGIAGLSAARTLQDNGCVVSVFDKGRKPGGRTASIEFFGHYLDLGAPVLSLKDPRIKLWVESWRKKGLIQDWMVREADWSSFDGQVRHQTLRQVASPTMRSLCLHVAEGVEIHQQTPVVSLLRKESQWYLGGENKDYGPYDAVLVAGAARQALSLLGDADPFAPELKTLESAPQWTVGMTFSDRLPLEVDLLKDPEGPIGLAIRESSKPGRPEGECWALHASRFWAADHVDMDRDYVAHKLSELFVARIGLSSLKPIELVAHRWRFGRVVSPLSAPCLWDEDRQMGLCGDYFRHATIEGAMLSGIAAAGRVLGSAKQSEIIGKSVQASLF